MSDYLAVAGVSVVLKWFLTNALTAAGGPASIYGNAVSVSVLPPDVVLTASEEPVRLNLFMYYSNVDAAFRNSRLPAYDSQGNRLTNPPLALDLHYLMSAYGPGEFDSEILLGWAMQQFQETPIFSRAAIQNWLAAAAGSPSPSIEVKAVALTTLPFQFESIKVTPAALSNDEISRLWMAFSTHYRATTAYRVSVVLIEEMQSVKSNLPVQQRTLKVLPLQGPTITAVTPATAPVGTVITLTGSNFIGDTATDTLVSFNDGTPFPPNAVQSQSIQVTVPSSLEAGVTTVRVVTRVSFGVPGDPHVGSSSNTMPFMVQPSITTAPPITVAAGGTLTLDLSPSVGQYQSATVFLGDFAISIPPRSSGPAESAALACVIPAAVDLPFTLPATVPLRVEIDRAQSPLTLDANPASSTYGKFLPLVEVT
jgi:Pvc16 N-terminal domain/IPT/TIG domain